MEARRKLKATRKEVFRVFVSSEARSCLGEHANRRDIGRMLLEERPQKPLGDCELIAVERGRRVEQVAVVDRCVDMLRVGLVGRRSVSGQCQRIAKFPPCPCKFRIQTHGARQRRNRLAALALAAKQKAPLEQHHGRLRLRSRKRLKDRARVCRFSLSAERRAQHQKRLGMSWNDSKDFARLLFGSRIVRTQQLRRMGNCSRNASGLARLAFGQ